MDRDTLGRVVREAWVRWAETQPIPKPTWLVPYDELSEPDKEADRQIGETVFRFLNSRRIELVEKKNRDSLSPQEYKEFIALQQGIFSVLDAKFPTIETDLARLAAIEHRLNH